MWHKECVIFFYTINPTPVSGQSLELFPVVLELGAGVLVVEFGQGTVDCLPGCNLLRGVLDTRNGLTTG